MQTIVIIGSSAAGLTAASLLCKISNTQIICLTKDTLAYNTCLLSAILSGKKTQEQSYLFVPEMSDGTFTIWYASEVNKIEKDTKKIILASREIISYDTLLIATGSQPRLLSNESWYKQPGVFSYHTLSDVIAIKNYIAQHTVSHATVIGAGINGLECAAALTHLGIEVTILERQDQTLKNIVDSFTATCIEDLFKNNKLVIKKNVAVENIEQNNHQKTLHLSDETTITTELVIIAIGSIPQVNLASEAGLEVNEGIRVNEYMQTSDDHIYAAGDCIEFFNTQENTITRPTLWHDAIAQAKIAAYAISGQCKKYPGFIPTLHTHFFDSPLVVCGTILNPFLIKKEMHDKGYSMLFLNASHELQGFILWGHKESFVSYKKMILDRIILPIGIN